MDAAAATREQSESDRAQKLESIFERYLDAVYRFLYVRVGNREDAEDLTSQVFLKATHQLDSSRTEASVASWLFTVARTVLADHWRRFYRAPPPLALDDLVVADAPHHLAEETSGEGSERLVQTVLRSLPPRYRRTLELRFLYGYSIDEAAAEMNVTSGNLKILQHRALARAASLGFPDLEESGRATPLHRADRDDLQDGYSSLRPEERTLL